MLNYDTFFLGQFVGHVCNSFTHVAFHFQRRHMSAVDNCFDWQPCAGEIKRCSTLQIRADCNK